MTESELIAFLAEPRTIRRVVEKFRVTRDTAKRWVEGITASSGYRIECGTVREARAGLVSKTYRAVRISDGPKQSA